MYLQLHIIVLLLYYSIVVQPLIIVNMSLRLDNSKIPSGHQDCIFDVKYDD